MTNFADSRKRIDRAIMHGRAISKIWKTIFDATRQPWIESVGQREFVVKAHIINESEDDISLRLGEYFYQLRAALDGAAFEAMVLETATDPPPRENSVEFPIYEKPDKFRNNPLVQTVPAEVVAWLESIQPYNIGKSSDAEINELGRRLKNLHDCARKDRHRRLHVAVGGMSKLQVRFETKNIKVSNVHGLPVDFLSGEVAFLGFDIDVTGPGETLLRIINVGDIELGVLEFPGLMGQQVMDELERIMLAARHIIDVFENGYPA